MRILVVDDDKLSVETLRTVIRDFGHEVATAGNGLEAMEALRQGGIRMVISDWMMPWMDGIELCKEIRRTDWPGYIYIILLTSRDGLGNVVEGLTAGADDFIVKPFRMQELNCRISTAERILAMETRDLAIFAMAKLAESRDPDTGAHLERVQNYSRVLAARLLEDKGNGLDVDPEFVRLIYLTSPLHDIGKVGVPDCILLKPGPLSEDEFDIMKKHTKIGADTLEAAAKHYPDARFLKMARDIALSHHERVDGNGYPHGLKGDEIPLAARIVALADVYDALVSKRVYKPPFVREIARKAIFDQAGSHFDLRVVKAFERCEMEFAAIHDKFNDETDPSRSAAAKGDARSTGIPESDEPMFLRTASYASIARAAQSADERHPVSTNDASIAQR